MNLPNRLARCCLPALLLALLTGCVSGGTMTLVEGNLEPRHFQFVTVVPRTVPGADGWREACVHVALRRATGDAHVCRLGVGMPLENKNGLIPTEDAQRRAARCANLAAQFAFESVTPATPLVLACQGFRDAYDLTLRGMVAGSRVSLQCHKKTTPSYVGP